MEEISLQQPGCDRCGEDALGVLGDEHLCETCVHEASACCGD
jgi:hypothetical protein